LRPGCKKTNMSWVYVFTFTLASVRFILADQRSLSPSVKPGQASLEPNSWIHWIVQAQFSIKNLHSYFLQSLLMIMFSLVSYKKLLYGILLLVQDNDSADFNSCSSYTWGHCRILAGIHIFPVKCNHQHAASIIRSASNHLWRLLTWHSMWWCSYHPHSGPVIVYPVISFFHLCVHV